MRPDLENSHLRERLQQEEPPLDSPEDFPRLAKELISLRMTRQACSTLYLSLLLLHIIATTTATTTTTTTTTTPTPTPTHNKNNTTRIMILTTMKLAQLCNPTANTPKLMLAKLTLEIK